LYLIGKFYNWLVIFVKVSKDYNLIKKYYLDGIKDSEISKLCNCNISTVYNVLKKMNVKKRNKRWTKEQINILKEKYGYEDWDILLDLLKPFNKDDIVQKAYKLGIKRNIFGWIEEEILILQNNYKSKSTKELMKLLPNKTTHAIATKANKIGLKSREKWTDEEIENIKKYYPIKDMEFLQNMFPNRSVSSIESMALKTLKLNKDDNYIEDVIKAKRKIILIEKLKEFGVELGRAPFKIEVDNSKNMPNISTYVRYFGCFTNACKLANLSVKYFRYGKNQVVYYSKNKDFCFSVGELVITNFLIDNSIKYVKDICYHKLINDNRCGLKRFDWIINDNIPVEYFGLAGKKDYDLLSSEKILICKDNNINLIPIYHKDLNNLDFIFNNYFQYN